MSLFCFVLLRHSHSDQNNLAHESMMHIPDLVVVFSLDTLHHTHLFRTQTTAFVSSLCTFGVGEACILFHSSLTFHMHMPLISTMVWNFTLKLKFLLSSSYLEKSYVLVWLFTKF